MSSLTWTKEKPTRNGFYWLWLSEETIVVQYEDEVISFHDSDQGYCKTNEYFNNALWAGPLEVPEKIYIDPKYKE